MRVTYIFIIIVYLLLALPSLQMLISLSPASGLAGVEDSAPLPELTVATLFNGEYATKFDRWFAENIGFRSFFIKTDNQINFSLFNELSAVGGTELVLGHNNYLFQKAYIDAWNNLNRVSDDQLEALAQKTKSLQDRLIERGIAFLVLVSPNKANIMSEYVPSRFLRTEAQGARRNFDVLREYFVKYGINFFDGPRYFQKYKKESPYPIFARGGTHWSYYGACLVSNELITSISTQLKKNMKPLRCNDVTLRDRPNPADRDIARLANIWTTSSFSETLAYPKRQDNSAVEYFRPRVLFVGSSFLWSVFNYLDRNRIYLRRDMYYYYNTNYRYPSREKRPIDRKNIDWSDRVFDKDAIVIESNEAAVESLGYGFIDDALANMALMSTGEQQDN